MYRARDTKLNRDVALKVLPDVFANDPERLARFQREAQVLASLNHPNIAAIHGLEETDPSTGPVLSDVRASTGSARTESKGSGRAVKALVLEFVEGPTLAERITQGRIPIDETLPIARQIAEALEAAHERGVTHRDLKPANIKIRPDGTVKVLDFGLAKALSPEGGATDLSNSPTISLAATQAGVILGTAAYMPPEQAKGKPVDKRADIWAFGCVLYEMLTGRRVFEGDDVSDTLAAVLKSDPDWSALPPETPPAIRKFLRRCLEKDPKRRVPDIALARFEIDETLTVPESSVVGATPPPPLPSPRAWQRPALLGPVAVLVGGVAAGLAVWTLIRPTPEPRQLIRLTAMPAAGERIGTAFANDPAIAVSPDGRRIVYASGTGQPQLYVRALDQLEATPFRGLGAPRAPFISPDGNWVGFFDGASSLKKVSISGGPAITLCGTGVQPRGASWGPNDTIIFATTDTSTGLLRVSASGGEPEVLTKPDPQKGENDHVYPEILPGGQAVLFTIIAGAIGNAQIAVLDLKSGAQKILVRGGSNAHYAASGHLVYGVAGTLRAVAFDLGRLEVVGDPIPALERVVTKSSGAANFALSHNGSLVYLAGDPDLGAQRTLVWVDRQGREEVIPAPPRAYTYPRLSPDGTKVAVVARDQEQDVWVWDFRRQTLTRLTIDPAEENYPVWTPDGRRILFSSGSAGAQNLYWRAADGTGTVERVTESRNQQFGHTFSPDGTRLIFRQSNPDTGIDLHVLSMDGERPSAGSLRQTQRVPSSSRDSGRLSASSGRPSTSSGRAEPVEARAEPAEARGEPVEPRRAEPLVQSSFAEQNAEISPDGKWIAYQSNESGQGEIYVRPFPDVNAGRWQVSTTGGSRPLWAKSGRELFYLAPAGALMRAPVEVGSTFTAGAPGRVLEGSYLVGTTGQGGGESGRTYDVSPDGQRFLMIKEGGADETSAPPQLIVVQNWHEELRRLAPRVLSP